MSKKLIKFLSALLMVCCLCVFNSCSDDDSPNKDNGGSDGGTQVDDGTVRILAIGNSFSEDAVEQNLWDLYNAAGIKATIGNLYIGGCSLETHYENAVANSAEYSYRKVVNGNKSTTANVTMLSGIVNEDWDYISIQQSSPLSGMYDTYVDYLPYLVNYIRTYAKNPNVKLVFHQTWAYAANSTHSGFANYGRDQMTMYNGIMDASKRAVEDNGIEILVPSGTAIQNGRTSWIGDNFNRDGYHLELTYGRLTAACTWFETLSGIDVTTTTYTPSGLDEKYKDVAVNAAHLAVQNPYAISDMSTEVTDPDDPGDDDQGDDSEDEGEFAGLPVSWMFCDVQGSSTDRDALQARQPHWATDGENYLVNDEDGLSTIKVIEAEGKSASELNGWAYNDGHAYIKGLYYNDYWLMTIPVKNLEEGSTINVCGSFGGSGSSAGFYIIEYSDDGQTWYEVPDTTTDTFNDTEVTYHCEVLDSYNAVDGWFSYDFPVSFSIEDGTLYIRFRVCANVRVTRNNTITTGGGGSSRMKGTFKVALAE